MSIIKKGLVIVIAIGGGVMLALVIPYARLQSAPIRILIISLAYIICFGGLAFLARSSTTPAGRTAVLKFALASTFVVVGVTVYEHAKIGPARSWIAAAAVAISLLIAARSRTTLPLLSRISWVFAAIAIVLILYWTAR